MSLSEEAADLEASPGSPCSPVSDEILGFRMGDRNVLDVGTVVLFVVGCTRLVSRVSHLGSEHTAWLSVGNWCVMG